MREALPTLCEALDAFLDDVGIAKAPLTRTAYAGRLRVLRDLSGTECPLSRLTPPTCRALIRDHMARYAPATVNTFCGALSSFGKYCAEQGWLLENPMRNISMPRVPERPHRFLSRAQLQHVLGTAEEMDARVHTGPRSVISLRTAVLLLSVGLRAAEACSVRRSEVADGLLLVHGKGSRLRYVPCPHG